MKTVGLSAWETSSFDARRRLRRPSAAARRRAVAQARGEAADAAARGRAAVGRDQTRNTNNRPRAAQHASKRRAESRGLDELLDAALDSLGGGFVALPGALLLALRLTLGLPLAAALLLLAAAASVLFAAQLLWALPLSAAVRLLLPRDPRAPPRPQRLRFEALRVVLVGGADATTVALGGECLRRGRAVSLVAPHGDALGAAEEELQDRAEEAETSEGRADGWAEEQVSSFAIDAPAGPKVRAILGAQFSAQFSAQFF